MGNNQSTVKQHYNNASKTGVLKLSQQKLRHVPKKVRELYGTLRTLDLSENFIEEIPSFIEQFQLLKHLDLNSNKLTDIPLQIGSLCKLEVLNLSKNYLCNLPYSLKNLENLKTLNLSNNQFKEFPKILIELKHLTELNMNSNQLTNIPIQVGLLQVTEMNLSNNQISCLPIEISQCPKLRILLINHNQLQFNEIRPQIFSNSKLINIQLDGNLFDVKNLRNIEGYDCYMQRCTDIKKKF